MFVFLNWFTSKHTQYRSHVFASNGIRFKDEESGHLRISGTHSNAWHAWVWEVGSGKSEIGPKILINFSYSINDTMEECSHVASLTVVNNNNNSHCLCVCVRVCVSRRGVQPGNMCLLFRVRRTYNINGSIWIVCRWKKNSLARVNILHCNRIHFVGRWWCSLHVSN